MQRWVSILLLVAFIRLQLVCCCGSIGYCAQKTENEALSEHCSGDSHASASHDGPAAEIASYSAASGTICSVGPCSDCLHCDHDPHHHIYLISRAFVGLVHNSQIQKTIVVQQFIEASVPILRGTSTNIPDSCDKRISLGLGCRALLMLAQLRI